MILALLLMVSASPQEQPVMFAGPRASLQKLTVAARGCGYVDARVVPSPYGHGADMVSMPWPTSDLVKHEVFGCIFPWMISHPELHLGIIGNAAR